MSAKATENLFLLEMNPFSDADLYCCDAEKIIMEIENGFLLGRKK